MCYLPGTQALLAGPWLVPRTPLPSLWFLAAPSGLTHKSLWLAAVPVLYRGHLPAGQSGLCSQPPPNWPPQRLLTLHSLTAHWDTLSLHPCCSTHARVSGGTSLLGSHSGVLQNGHMSLNPQAAKFWGEISQLQISSMIAIAHCIHLGQKLVQNLLFSRKKMALPRLGLHKLLKTHPKGGTSPQLGRGMSASPAVLPLAGPCCPASRTSLKTHRKPQDACAA